MANGAFNRGSNNAGRKRDGSRLPSQSASEGNVGNVIPRPTTIASIRRAQSLMNILNDKQSGGNTFSRGTTKGGVRRNFSMMAQMSLAGGGAPFSVQAVGGAQSFTYQGLIQFSSVNYDPNSMWSPPEKIVCQSDGTYSVEYTVNIVSRASLTSIILYKNGAMFDSDIFGAGSTTLTGSTSVALVATDEVTIFIIDLVGIGPAVEVTSAVFTVAKT
jgi:hypothetical protein